MKQIAYISETTNQYPVYLFDKITAQKYIEIITQLVQQIPLVEYTEEEILSERKGERVLYGKWDYSLIAFDNDQPIALLMAYERAAEQNQQYPENSIYISELAVSEKYQRKGIAKGLLKIFFNLNRKQKLGYLPGEVSFSVQTNSAKWNDHVQKLYSSFGFNPRATKQYNNREDIVFEKK